MMEFMMSRVCTCLCAALIIGILVPPISDSFNDDAENGIDENCKAFGIALDMFARSMADESVLSLRTYIPGDNVIVSFSGNILTMTSDEGVHEYPLNNEVETDAEWYGCHDTITLRMDGDVLRITSVGS